MDISSDLTFSPTHRDSWRYDEHDDRWIGLDWTVVVDGGVQLWDQSVKTEAIVRCTYDQSNKQNRRD